MSLFKAKKLCHLCSYRSIEFKQFAEVKKGVSNTRTFQKSNIGLTCTKCNGFVCIDCMQLLVPVMSRDAKHYCNHDLLDAFKEAISPFSKIIKTPVDYIGHCCTISRPSRLPASAEGDEVIHKMPFSNCPDLTPRLSGCIFFPEFDIFIDSPMNCMDIHAVGAEVKNVVRKAKRKRSGKPTPPQKIEYLPARWHCVVPHPFALENNSKAPIRNGVLPAGWKMMFLRKIKIKSPHNNQIIKKVSCL